MHTTSEYLSQLTLVSIIMPSGTLLLAKALFWRGHVVKPKPHASCAALVRALFYVGPDQDIG